MSAGRICGFNDGTLAVGSDDGFVKEWTLEGLVASIGTTVLTYGPEMPAMPAADLAFRGDWIVVADINGLVTAWATDGVMQVLGGTEPGISMTAVAIDPTGNTLAHAEAVSGGNIMVRTLDGSRDFVGPVGPIERAH